MAREGRSDKGHSRLRGLQPFRRLVARRALPGLRVTTQLARQCPRQGAGDSQSRNGPRTPLLATAGLLRSFTRRGSLLAAVLLLVPLLAVAEEPPLLWDGVVGHGPTGPIECSITEGSIHYLVTFEGGGDGTYIEPDNHHYIPGTPIRFALPWRTLVNGPFANNPSPPTIAFWDTGTRLKSLSTDRWPASAFSTPQLWT